MFQHTPRMRRLVNGLAMTSLVIGTITLFTILYLLLRQGWDKEATCQQWLEETIRPLSYNAEVHRIVQESSCLFRIYLSTPVPDYLLFCPCEEEGGMLESLAKGDSIFKKKNQLSLTVKKEGTVWVVPYPCCE